MWPVVNIWFYNKVFAAVRPLDLLVWYPGRTGTVGSTRCDIDALFFSDLQGYEVVLTLVCP